MSLAVIKLMSLGVPNVYNTGHNTRELHCCLKLVMIVLGAGINQSVNRISYAVINQSANRISYAERFLNCLTLS